MTAPLFDPAAPDNRSIDDMAFGDGFPDREAVAERVRAALRACGVNFAHEIETLGCTGALAKGLSVEDIRELRMGLGGGGVGLPCFVPPTRFCLAHNTIGGLQEQQQPRYPEQTDKISRPLNAAEKGQMEYIESARRVRGSNLDDRLMKTADALRGRELPPGVEITADDVADAEPVQPPVLDRKIAFVCPEHDKKRWNCRYCVAEMIVAGELAPSFATAADSPSAEDAGLTPTELEALLDEADKQDLPCIDVYALVVRLERKLTRTRL